MKRLALLVIAVILMSGCGGKRVYGLDPGVTVTSNQSLPAPDNADISGGARPYFIGPFDKLTIDVFGIEDLKKEVQTDASGHLSFPLAGEIEASGKTPNQVAAIIRERLQRQYIRDPQVTVNLLETVSQVITVDGEVREPGLFPVVGNMTLMRAIARAKGLGEFARLQDVVVFRTVNGQRMAGLYNLKAIRQGNYEDPEVFAGDVVVVGDSAARRRFRDIIQAAPALLTPIVVLLTQSR